MAAVTVRALVKGKAQLGCATGGQQTEHPPDSRPQVELRKHGVGKGAEDAAQSVKDSGAVLCLEAEPIHGQEVVSR
jgi:hypothetical protein